MIMKGESIAYIERFVIYKYSLKLSQLKTTLGQTWLSGCMVSTFHFPASLC